MSTSCLNPLISLNKGTPNSLFGTLPYFISISTFVQIQKQLIATYGGGFPEWIQPNHTLYVYIYACDMKQ